MDAEADRAQQVIVVVVDGEHDDLGRGKLFAQQGGGLEAVHDGHLDVHHDDVGVQRLGLFECVDAVDGLPDDVEVGLSVDDGGERAAEQALVVDDEHADGLGGCGDHEVARAWA